MESEENFICLHDINQNKCKNKSDAAKTLVDVKKNW